MFLDFVVTIGELQFNNNVVIQFIIDNYHSERHAIAGQYIKGFTPMGALHALIMNMFFIVHFTLLPYVKRKILFMIPCFLEIFIVLTSGSRTHILGLVFFVIVFVIVSLFRRSRKTMNGRTLQMLVIFISILAGIYIVINYSEYFFKLNYLIDNIESGDSKGFGGRKDIWEVMVKYLLKMPFFVFIGWGKTYMLVTFSTFFTDNDYLAIIISYGLIALIVLLTIIGSFIYKATLKIATIKPLEEIIYFICIQTLLISFASSGFYMFYWQVFILLLLKFLIEEKKGHINYDKLKTI
ncbi:MAG: O-antigen ligase family protein [Flavobacteriales bacterium]